MEIRVHIDDEENDQVELLFTRFIGYCEILGYLAKYGSIDTDLFDKKWEEAVIINKELEALKTELDIKYHPLDSNYTNYRFDFLNHEMVYVC